MGGGALTTRRHLPERNSALPVSWMWVPQLNRELVSQLSSRVWGTVLGLDGLTAGAGGE